MLIGLLQSTTPESGAQPQQSGLRQVGEQKVASFWQRTLWVLKSSIPPPKKSQNWDF